MESIFGFRYRVWVINTTTKTNLFLWSKWRTLLPYLDRLIGLSEQGAYIRTQQSFNNENQWLGFGRMKWNLENNEKWTSKYRTQDFSDKELIFFDTEVWAPDWNECSRVGKPPEIFIQLYHNPAISKVREGLVIAIKNKTARRNKGIIETNVEGIKRLIPNSTSSMICRGWMPGWRYFNRIEDINTVELEKIIYGD